MQNMSQEPSNTICPVCGSAVDESIQPVVAVHQAEEGDDAVLRIGTCCDECRCRVVADPDYFFSAAIDNAVAVGG